MCPHRSRQRWWPSPGNHFLKTFSNRMLGNIRFGSQVHFGYHTMLVGVQLSYPDTRLSLQRLRVYFLGTLNVKWQRSGVEKGGTREVIVWSTTIKKKIINIHNALPPRYFHPKENSGRGASINFPIDNAVTFSPLPVELSAA